MNASPYQAVYNEKDNIGVNGSGINKMWNLDENSTLLHALSLYNPYGIIASLMSPLSVGGRVVILPQFDTMKVWSHLLGIQINGEYVPRTNIYAGVPTHYDNLMKRYKEVFTVSDILIRYL